MNHLCTQFEAFVNAAGQVGTGILANNVGGLARAPELLKYYGKGSNLQSPVLFSALAMLLGLILILMAIRAYRHPTVKAHPLTTFNHLAGVLRLSWRDRVLLVRIARHAELATPLTLLLSTATLHHYARLFAKEQTLPGRMRVMKRIMAIRRAMADPPRTAGRSAYVPAQL